MKNHPTEVHLGRLIAARIKEVGMTKAEFGRRINTSRQNVNTLLRKESLDTRILSRISKVLDFDFFVYYLEDKADGKSPSSSSQPLGTTHLSFSIKVNSPAQLSEIYAVLARYGHLPT